MARFAPTVAGWPRDWGGSCAAGFGYPLCEAHFAQPTWRAHGYFFGQPFNGIAGRSFGFPHVPHGNGTSILFRIDDRHRGARATGNIKEEHRTWTLCSHRPNS